jgi:hypothetical protein
MLNFLKIFVISDFTEQKTFRVDKMAVFSYMPVISDWRNNLVGDNKFIRIYDE